MRALAMGALVCAVSAAPAYAAAIPPTITKTFSASSVLVNGNVFVYFTITNNDGSSDLSNVSFSDSLPAGLEVANPNQASTDCGGTITATPASSSISFSGGTLPASSGENPSACHLAVELKATTAGTKDNTTGAVSSTESGPGGTSNTASVDVESSPTFSPPTIDKAFSTSTTALNTPFAVYFTIKNPNIDANATTLHNVSFSDSLPSGLEVANPNQASTDCGGTLTAVPGSSSISFSGGTIDPPQAPDYTGGTCDIAVEVTATSTGTKDNTTGAVSSTETGSGSTSNTASVDITATPAVSAPTLSKAFGAASIEIGATTSLTFTVTNPNSSQTFSGVSFTDTLPAGLRVATPNGATGSCLSLMGAAASAPSGGNSIELDGAAMPANGSCTLTVDVVGVARGVQDNTTGKPTGTYDNGSGDGAFVSGTPATASLTVIGPPVLTKSFGARSIRPGGTTTLTFKVVNPNTQDSLTGIGFSDSLPPGLRIAVPNGLTGSCGGGTISAPGGSGTINLVGASLAPGSSCTFSVRVKGTADGSQQNMTSQVNSNEGGPGPPASATVVVGLPPSILKRFTPRAIARGRRAMLTFAITNPNTGLALTGLHFTDTLPAGVVPARPSRSKTTCPGGGLSFRRGGVIVFAGGQLGHGKTCFASLEVVGTRTGIKHNRSGPVSARETGVGNRASSSLTVIGRPDVKIRIPHKHARFTLGQVVHASYRCKEGPHGPGLQSCIGPVPNHALLDTSTPGRHTFRVAARSKDGLTRTRTRHYRVLPP